MTSSPSLLRKIAAHRNWLIAIAVAALCACAPLHAQTPNATPPAASAPHAQGVVLVAPRAGVSVEELDRILAPYGGKRERYMPALNVHVVRLPADADVARVAAALSQDPRIQYAQPDALRSPQGKP